MADFITIDQVLQYLHKSPGDKWEKFELKTVEYFDVNVLDLEFVEYNGDEAEVLQITISAKGIDIDCNIRRSISHVIIEPVLTCRIEKLELFGTRSSGYNLQLMKEALKLYTRVSIDIEVLERFVEGKLNELWNIKPEY